MDIKSTNLEVIKRHFDIQAEWVKSVREADKERASKTVAMIPKDTSSILEVGCGNGIIINEIAKSKFAVGLDFSNTALKYVNREKVMGDCVNLPFAAKTFDMVIAAEVLEHLDQRTLNNTLLELQRVAKRYILVSVPFREKPWETFVKCGHCGHAYSPYGHQQYFDRKRVEWLIKSKQQVVEFSGRRKALPWLTRFGQIVFGAYSYRKNSICPRCNSNVLKYGILTKTYERVCSILKVFAGVQPNWILCLYKVEYKFHASEKRAN